jgi:hypothetical protein
MLEERLDRGKSTGWSAAVARRNRIRIIQYRMIVLAAAPSAAFPARNRSTARPSVSRPNCLLPMTDRRSRPGVRRRSTHAGGLLAGLQLRSSGYWAPDGGAPDRSRASKVDRDPASLRPAVSTAAAARPPGNAGSDGLER